MAQQWYDIVIVGGGIVGLATARDFLMRRPGCGSRSWRKNPTIGQHQTGHNSGVIHAGVYYAPGSLKARLCSEGRQKTYEYCEEKGIPYEKCGKLIVAIDESELPRLQNLWDRATANGVPGIRMVGPEEIREIEPYCAGIKGSSRRRPASWTGVEVAQAYADDVIAQRRRDPDQLRGHGIRRKGDWVLLKTTFDEIIPTRYLITCAGLALGPRRGDVRGGQEPADRAVPGRLPKLKPEKTYMTRGMIYPVPDPAFPFLGVHFTRRMDGEVWLGPNAVYAFARRGVRQARLQPPRQPRDADVPGFWKMVPEHWKMGMRRDGHATSTRSCSWNLQEVRARGDRG